MDQKTVSPAIERFVSLASITGKRLLVRAAQVVAVKGTADGTTLYLASGGILNAKEDFSSTGLKFHNAMTAVVIDGEKIAGQFSYRSGYLTSIEETVDESVCIVEFVGGHRLTISLSFERWQSSLNATEHPQGTPYSWPSWA